MSDEKAVHYLKLELATQGNTASPSRVKITATDISGNRVRNPLVARCRICNAGTFTNSTNATIAAANGSTVAETITSTKDLVLASAVATKAAGTLTITGGGKHGEVVVIGPRTYKFDALGTGTPAVGEVLVDISADAVVAKGTLTITDQITAGDTMVIGSKNYVFVGHGLANSDGEISIGASEANAKANICAAILGTDGFNTAHPDVTCPAAFTGDALVLTAKLPGTIGNAIVTTETFTGGTNVFDAAVLGTTQAGADPTDEETAIALNAAINGDHARVVDSSRATAVLTVSAVQPGASYNSYPTTETMANASWGAGTLAGGKDDGRGEIYIDVTDAQAETVTQRVGQPPQGGLMMDCSESLDIAHAAP